MSVHDFQMYLENCNQVADWMPSTSPILTDDELKRVFVQAMPDTWQTAFSRAGRMVTSCTLLEYILLLRKPLKKGSNNKKTPSLESTTVTMAMEDISE